MSQIIHKFTPLVLNPELSFSQASYATKVGEPSLFFNFTQFLEQREEMESGSPHDLMAKVWDCGFEAIKFEPQSCHNVHFRTNSL